MSELRVVLGGTVAVAAPPGEALELFTPEGERRWIDGWDPAWVHPATGALAPGAVFRTTRGGYGLVQISCRRFSSSARASSDAVRPRTGVTSAGSMPRARSVGSSIAPLGGRSRERWKLASAACVSPSSAPVGSTGYPRSVSERWIMRTCSLDHDGVGRWFALDPAHAAAATRHDARMIFLMTSSCQPHEAPPGGGTGTDRPGRGRRRM